VKVRGEQIRMDASHEMHWDDLHQLECTWSSKLRLRDSYKLGEF
jgi:hypothetical protein